MFKSAFPVIFIIAAVGLFYTYIDPIYKNIQTLLQEEATFDEALNKSRELLALRDSLLAKRNAFSANDLERLNKLLPDHVDNVRLALDLDGIASKYNMRIKNISVSQSSNNQAGTLGPSQKSYESIVLSFSVAASYEDLISFLKDLERSLRIVDVTQLSFNQPTGDLYEYRISIQMYWLR